MTENDQKEYTGWREPKIAMSFHRNRLWYYGIVWLFILLFLFFTEVNLDTYNVFWKRTINFLYIDIYNLNYIMKNSLKSKQLNLFMAF